MSRAIHRTDHKGGDDFGKARPTVRRGRRSIASAIEVRDNRSVAARVFSWVANKIPDRYLNRALALVIGLTGFFGWRIHNQLQDPGRSSQAIAAAPDYPQYSLDRPLPSPSAARNDFVASNTASKPTLIAPPIMDAPKLDIAESDPLQMVASSESQNIEQLLRNHISTMAPHDRALREFIFHAEGIRSCQYKCTAGKRTIGIGLNLDVEANRITFRETIPCTNKEFQAYLDGEKGLNAEQVMALFEADLAKRLKILNNKFDSRGMDFDKLPSGARIVLTSLCINNPGLVGNDMLGYIEQKDWKNAACEIALRCNVKKDERLRVRRMTEANTFLNATTGQDLSLKMLGAFRKRNTPLNAFDVEGFNNFREQWPAIQGAMPTVGLVSNSVKMRISSAERASR